jgi:predicted ribosome quality control (RQC) complex YloA/Tae2 family protein
MSLTNSEIATVLAEWEPLRGAVVQKVYVPRERLVVLELRIPGQSHLLLLCAEPNRTRLHLVGGRPPSPDEALPLQQQLRAHLIGRKLENWEQPSDDRVVVLHFADAEGKRQLVAELTGRSGNLFLLSASGMIVARAVPAEGTRDLLPGKPYAFPQRESEGANANANASRNRFVAGPDFAANRAVEAEYEERDRVATERELRTQLERPLRTRIDKLKRTIAKVEVEAARTDAAERHRLSGELLKSALPQVPRGASTMTLTDYSSGEAKSIEVQLKPELSPKDNLDWHFRQYRRLSQGSAKAAQRLAQVREELAQAQQELARIAALDLDGLRAKAPAPTPAAPLPESKSKSKSGGGATKRPYKEFVSSQSKRIWVGKGAAENDQLSLKLARGHDLWLHARGLTGAHVVVPLQRGEQVLPEVLLDACALAVHFSSAKGQSHVEVSYLPARYLRKPKGGRPGQVLYSQEKTLRYTHEPERIARLLASQNE